MIVFDESVPGSKKSVGATWVGDEESRMEAMSSIILRTNDVECVALGSDCWVWALGNNSGGVRGGAYSRIKMFGKDWKGHRLMYLLYFGKLTGGLEIDHRCEESLCVNPSHLQEITGAFNNKLNHTRRKK